MENCLLVKEMLVGICRSDSLKFRRDVSSGRPTLKIRATRKKLCIFSRCFFFENQLLMHIYRMRHSSLSKTNSASFHLILLLIFDNLYILMRAVRNFTVLSLQVF